MITINDRDAIVRLYEDKTSYREIARRYKVSDTTVRNWLKRFGISVTHRKQFPKYRRGRLPHKIILVCEHCGKNFEKLPNRSGKFCSIQCSEAYKSQQRYRYYLTHQDEFYGKSIQFVKRHILQEQNCCCAICGMKNEWNDKPMTLILDHINGRSFDNARNNLRMVCPNCDSQLDTYKSKNKNSDRAYFRKAYHNSVAHARVIQKDRTESSKL